MAPPSASRARHAALPAASIDASRLQIDNFLEMMSVERAASASTLKNYGRDLLRFSTFAAGRGETLLTAGADDIAAWLVDLEASGLAASTAALKTSALKQFFQFLYAEGHRGDNPAANVARPRTRRPLPKSLSVDETTALLDALALDKTPRGLRMMALVEVLYGAGLRVSELVSLPYLATRRLIASHADRNQANAGAAGLIIRGKGDKERFVPLGGAAQRAMSAYLDVRPTFIPQAADGESPWLFPSRGKTGRLTPARFAQLLKLAGEKVGIPRERLSPHVLRHAFATHLVDNGADLRTVQELLGHADITTTEIYTHVAKGRLRELVLKAHPLAKK